MTQTNEPPRMPLRVDLISDVVCPWCIIGFLQFQKALQEREGKIELELHWLPFELNPQMPAEGQDMREHLAQKYGSTPQQSQSNRQRLAELGTALGFEFNTAEGMRMVNTFRAHQLLHWASEQGLQTELQLALFRAFFTKLLDVNDTGVLLEVVEQLGLPTQEAAAVLAENRYAEPVRSDQQRWTEEGIQAVPCFVINQQYLVQGAQDATAFGNMLDKMLAKSAA